MDVDGKGDQICSPFLQLQLWSKNMALDARGVARDKEFECFDSA